MLGLVSGKTFADNNWNTMNTRRKVFHDFPTGEFTLTGLLSMLDTDWVDSPEFGWNEKTWVDPETLIKANGVTNVPFTTSGGTVSPGASITLTAGNIIRMHVEDNSAFRAKNVLRIDGLPLTGGGLGELFVIVVDRVSTNALEVEILETLAAVINTANAIDGVTAGPVNCPVACLGNANAEGSGFVNSTFRKPYRCENFTQIFNDGFSITGTSAQVPTDFDAQGSFRNQAKDVLLAHMTGIEKAMLFGIKTVDYVEEDGDTVPRRTLGGITHFLKEYEKANSVYRGGTGAPALTANTDNDKRIIRANNAAGELSFEFFEGVLMERLFRCTSNKGFEKLGIVGSGFFAALNNYIRKNVTVNKNFRAETIYGMHVTTLETPFGVVRFATHPLFSRSIQYRNDVLMLDVHNLKFRPLKNRDTKRYSNQARNDEDKVKHKWLTEASLELRRPQSHMWLRGIKKFVD